MLCYVDDIVVITDIKGDLEKVLSTVERSLWNRHGMRINKGRTGTSKIEN